MSDQPRLAPQPIAPAQVVAGVLGTVLVIAGLIGLAVDTSFHTGAGIDGHRLLGLEVNGWHNIVHVASGLLLLAGLGSNRRARRVCQLFGLTYLVVTIVGLADGDDIFGLFPINPADNVLHALLALVALWAAKLSKDKRGQLSRDRVIIDEAEPGNRIVGPGSGHVGGPRATQPRIDRRLPVKVSPPGGSAT
ncbi:MAG: DUF4383 domain-containing protein [Solirubrobacteraceae bacterium]